MTSPPENIEPRTSIEMPNLEMRAWRTYPIVDHIADKFAAIVETHGVEGNASSRYRDLVDIALITTTQELAGEDLRRAINSEFRFRRLEQAFEISNVKAWEAAYTAIQRELNNLQLDFAEAYNAARRVFEIVRRDGRLTWDPKSLDWKPRD